MFKSKQIVSFLMIATFKDALVNLLIVLNNAVGHFKALLVCHHAAFLPILFQILLLFYHQRFA